MSALELERMVREIARQAPDAMLLTSSELDPPGPTILYVNSAFTRLTGYREDEVVGKTPRILQGPSTSRAVLGRLRDQLSKGQPFSGETINYRKDGGEFVMQWTITPIRDEHGNVTRWLAIQRDVTDSRRKLQLSEQRLRSVVATAPDFLLILTPSGEIEFLNRTLPGLRFDDVVGLSAYEFVDPENHAVLRESIESVLATGEMTSCEFSGLGPGGSKSWYSTRLGPYIVDEETRGVICVATDITKRRLAENNAQRMQAELARVLRLATVSEMTAILAHEINQPLSSISNYAHGAARALADREADAELPAVLKHIEQQALFAGRIVNNLKHYLRNSESVCELADVHDLIHEAVAFVQPQAKENRVDIAVEASDRIPPINVVRVQIQQVLVNLLQNAIEALASRPCKNPKVKIRVADLQDHILAIEVTDNGPGMPQDIYDRAFEPFFSTKRNGLGMGLNISRSIIESHQGQLAVATQESGASITIQLPVESSCDSAN